MAARVRVINLEEGFPTRDQAYQKLEAALVRARKDGVAVVKVIHGYGSTGAGGVLRFAIRGFLRQRKEKGEMLRSSMGKLVEPTRKSHCSRRLRVDIDRCRGWQQGNHDGSLVSRGRAGLGWRV
jgi:hypothetical protein